MVSLFNFYLGGNDYAYSTNYCNVTKHVGIYYGTYLYLVRLIKNWRKTNMQVKYLIELLQKENPDAEVRLHGFDHRDGGEDIVFVCRLGVGGTVRIDGKYDVDLNRQIVSRYKNARRTNQSSDELHRDLRNHSITVAEVEEAMGIDSACEYKKYLEENKS